MQFLEAFLKFDIFMILWLSKRSTTQSFTNWGRNVDISCIYVYLCIPIKQNEGSRVSRELMLLLSSHLHWCLHFCLSKPFSTSSLLHYNYITLQFGVPGTVAQFWPLYVCIHSLHFCLSEPFSEFSFQCFVISSTLSLTVKVCHIM